MTHPNFKMKWIKLFTLVKYVQPTFRKSGKKDKDKKQTKIKLCKSICSSYFFVFFWIEPFKEYSMMCKPFIFWVHINGNILSQKLSTTLIRIPFMPAFVQFFLADEKTTGNLWIDCEIRDNECVWHGITAEVQRGKRRPRLCPRQAGIVSDRKLSKEWSSSAQVTSHSSVQAQPHSPRSSTIYKKYYFGSVYNRGVCWSSSLLSAPVYTNLKRHGIMQLPSRHFASPVWIVFMFHDNTVRKLMASEKSSTRVDF